MNRTAVDTSVTSVVNSSHVLDCPVSGVPAPRVVWTRDSRPIDPRRDTNVELRAAGRRLVIRSVGVADAGTYRCVASNAAGQDFVDFDLVVHGQ